MAKKKKNSSDNYWMKFGGELRKMNMGGFDDNAMGSGYNYSTSNSLTPEYVEFNPTYTSSGSGTKHVLNGSTITPSNPQYVPGHQRGGSPNIMHNSGSSPYSNSNDYVYRNGGPVTPPTEEQAAKSKGTLKGTSSGLTHGRWNRPEVWESMKEEWGGRFEYLTNSNIPPKNVKSLGTDPLKLLLDKYLPKNTKEMGGSAGEDQTSDIVNDPTFKTWYATNAKRSDVAQSSSNLAQLKSLFLSDINFPDNAEMPVFSDEIDDYGNTDKSQRDLGMSMDMINRENQTEPNDKKIFFDNKRYGGRNLPKYATGGNTSGIRNNDSRNYDISGRNSNGAQGIGAIGDSNALQALGPWGYAADFVADIIGHSGNKAQHRGQVSDKNEATSTLNLLTTEGINKDSLDMSTRLSGLGALANYNQPAPSNSELFGEIAQTAGSFAMNEGANMLKKGGGQQGGSNGTEGDGTINDGTGEGELLAAFGGYMQNGGSLAMQPGAGTGIEKLMNPYSSQAQMQSSGMDQASQGGPTQEAYEAEGGEAIMHAPGGQPATSGNLKEVTENLSVLEGSSHEKGGEEVSGEGEQYVFSKKLKSKEWKKSFADAAETIGNNISKYEKLIDESNSDAITVSTANAMVQSWTQKLSSLQEEQETAREAKFMGMVNGGAGPEQLQKNFPDLYESFMAEQQMEAQGQQMAPGSMEQEAQMATNPMGSIDTSALSGESQGLVEAKYGLPKYNHGGSHDEFNSFDFNTYANNATGFGVSNDFDLGNNYTPRRSELMDYLTLNFPDDGIQLNADSENFTNPKDAYKGIMADFNTQRSAHIEGATGLTGKPKKSDYKEDGSGDFNMDEAAWKLHNSGLPNNWKENYGVDANISERQYFKGLYNSLIVNGTDADLANTIVNKQKMEKQNLNAVNLEASKKSAELTDEEKAVQEVARLSQTENRADKVSNMGRDLLSLAPTIYNMAQGNAPVEQTQFVGNKNEQEILKNLELLKNNDISDRLKSNEQTLNMTKYLARNASDGSSGSVMNMLNTSQAIKTGADNAAYTDKAKLDMQGSQISLESLYNLGENDRQENINMDDADAQNRAASQAFTAKGFEGLSGFSQMKEKMKNSAARDEQLKGLLGQIYPDAEMYMKNGEMDIDKILEENPKLKEYFKKYIR